MWFFVKIHREMYKSNKLFISYSDIIFNEEAITKIKINKK